MTQAYNVARNAGNKQAMIDAEKMADAIRVQYYICSNEGYCTKSKSLLPKDIKYTDNTYDMLMESKYGNTHEVPLIEDPTFFLVDGSAALGKLLIKKVTTGIASGIVRGLGAEDGFLKLDLQLFAKKDLKMVNDAAKSVGVDRDAFGEYIHELKQAFGMRANQNFTYQELIEYAKELKNAMGK